MTYNVMGTPSASERKLSDNQVLIEDIHTIDTIEARFGNHVRVLRKTRCITQEQLAIECGWHQHYISEIECGKRNVSLRVVENIARALGVTSKELL